MARGRVDIKSMLLSELTAYITLLGQPAFRAKQLYEWIHRRLATDFSEMSNLPLSLREQLSEQCVLPTMKTLRRVCSACSETQKFLFAIPKEMPLSLQEQAEAADIANGTSLSMPQEQGKTASGKDGLLLDEKTSILHNTIESVLMCYPHGNSVCVSSQAGCRMGCRFCASTLGGLSRNLVAAEMLDQVYQITRLAGMRVSHIVVMGTGEPLDNYDNLVRFLRLATDEKGLGISRRSITVSTCGLPEQIRRLASERFEEELPVRRRGGGAKGEQTAVHEGIGVTLALSLHAPNDALRQTLMPVAKRYALAEVLDAVQEYTIKTGRRATFEYSLIHGVNDSLDCARELAQLLSGYAFSGGAHVNLIPVNAIEERTYEASDVNNQLRFKEVLEKYKINATIRKEMGADIQAACGQLRKREQNGAQEKTENRS